MFDSGASETIIQSSLVKNLKSQKTQKQQWNTAAGKIHTNKLAKLMFNLPEFYESKIVQCWAHVFEAKLNYDMIIGRDLMMQLGININFKNKTINWMDAEVPMRNPQSTSNEFFIQETGIVEDAMTRVKNILDAKYEPANLEQVVAECTHLSKEKQEKLLKLLNKHKTLFDGSLGEWKKESLNIEVKEGAKPYHARAYPIPKIHEQTLKMEVERLCKEGVLKRVNRSEWAAPTFIIPKKDRTVRFISDFRELNKRIKRKPYPIPKIQDLMLKLEGFTHGTSLDLNMGYYHITLTPESKKLCTITLPWGKYEYQRLPMGLCNSQTYFKKRCPPYYQT